MSFRIISASHVAKAHGSADFLSAYLAKSVCIVYLLQKKNSTLVWKLPPPPPHFSSSVHVLNLPADAWVYVMLDEWQWSLAKIHILWIMVISVICVPSLEHERCMCKEEPTVVIFVCAIVGNMGNTCAAISAPKQNS